MVCRPQEREDVVCRSDQVTPCVITLSSDGAATNEARVDYTTTPGKVPTAVTVVGRVTSAPGDYELRLALLAEVPGHTDPHQFLRTIPVKVAPATSS